MIGCPWLAVTFAGEAGMAICFILFYAVNPLFSIFCGVFAGSHWKRRWYLPLVSAGTFLLGTWLFFEMGEPAFLLYTGCYLALGMISMLIRCFFRNNGRKTDL